VELDLAELEQARSRLTACDAAVQIFAMFPTTSPPHWRSSTRPAARWIACWPLQVRSPDEAERKSRSRSDRRREMHERTFEGDLNWRLSTSVSRRSGPDDGAGAALSRLS